MTAWRRIDRRWRHLPFAHKLALLLIVMVSLPIVAGVAYTTAASREALILATRARHLERARGTAEVIDAFIADALADVRVASLLPAIVALCERPEDAEARPEAQRSLLAMRNEQRFLALYVTDREGRVLSSTDERVAIGSYQTGRAFLSAMAGDSSVVDDPTYEPFDRRVALRVSRAVRNAGGDILGATIALIDVEALDALVGRDANFGGLGEFSVLWTGPGVRLSDSLDRRQRFTSWAPLPPDTRVVVQRRLGPAYPAAATGDPGFAAVAERGAWLLYDRTSDPHLRVAAAPHGVLHVTAVPLASERWVYGIFVPEARVLASLGPQMARDWSVAFFTVVAGLVLAMIAARWVTQPLRRMTEAANALASGDMTRRVGLDQQDEFGQVGDAFDGMANALADKERQLQAHAADLERRVEERTATLQLLERASRMLSASLEPRRTADTLAALVVPSVADFCAIDVREPHGHLRRIACRHADGTLQLLAHQRLGVRQVPDPASTLTAEERAVLEIDATRVYELSTGRQFVGYLTVAMKRGGREIDEETERIVEELGRRASLALANALLYEEAQDANRLKDEFLGVVSHELRTPLNAIMGWTRLAGQSRDAGIQAADALDAVERNARALARLVDDLLDVPRIMTGKLALDIRPVDLVPVVQAATDAVRPSAAAKQLTLEVQSDVASATLEADPHRLQQVFWNLLSNAVKFTPRGGRIAVRLGAEADRFVVVISDTGIGIRPDFLPFVFERFRQADSSTTRAHGGLGIGLSIVRQLVEMHGGAVEAASDGPGQGSTFTVRLPVPYRVDEAARPSAADAEGLDAGVVRDLRLLVLDDDADAREVMARLMAAMGAGVTMTTSVAEALDRLAATPAAYDLVLADIGMPGEDGYGFIAGLRAHRDPHLRTLPAIAVTAYASRGDSARALAAGFDAHVAKPVAVASLTAAIARVLARRSSR